MWCGCVSIRCLAAEPMMTRDGGTRFGSSNGELEEDWSVLEEESCGSMTASIVWVVGR